MIASTDSVNSEIASLIHAYWGDKMSADKNTLFSHDNNELSRNWSRMARKNFLAGLVDVDVPLEQEPTSYPMRGASKTMIRSIDEMAKQGDRCLEGEAVVELEPGQVDGSFISDRLDDDQAEFEALVEAIKAQGCSTGDRYQVVFDHRRLKAAKAPVRKVRAVVKNISGYWSFDG